MVATNDDLLKELKSIRTLLEGLYYDEQQAKARVTIESSKVIV